MTSASHVKITTTMGDVCRTAIAGVTMAMAQLAVLVMRSADANLKIASMYALAR